MGCRLDMTDHSETVEMAAVLWREFRDEPRPPAGHKAVVLVVRAQAREGRVGKPQLVAPVDHLVDLHIARHVQRPRQETSIVLARRFEPWRNRRHIAELDDLLGRADGQTLIAHSQAHWLVEVPKMRVDQIGILGVTADYHKLAGLVGGDQERHPKLVKDAWKVGRVDAA